MRCVLDTNVLMSGIFFGGVPGRVLDAWTSGRIELILSPEILAEYRTVGEELSKRYPERGEALAPILTLLALNATIVAAPPLPYAVSADPDDDKFLATARALSGTVVVSGDRHLLAVDGWDGVEVLSPRAFVTRHLAPG